MHLICRFLGHRLGWPRPLENGIIHQECFRCFEVVESDMVLWDLDTPRKIYKLPDMRKIRIPRQLSELSRFGRKRA